YFDMRIGSPETTVIAGGHEAQGVAVASEMIADTLSKGGRCWTFAVRANFDPIGDLVGAKRIAYSDGRGPFYDPVRLVLSAKETDGEDDLGDMLRLVAGARYRSYQSSSLDHLSRRIRFERAMPSLAAAIAELRSTDAVDASALAGALEAFASTGLVEA